MVLVLFGAAALRLSYLPHRPIGIYHDPAYNGLDAIDVLQGHFPLFFPANNGREPLFIYLQAGSVALFGTTVFALRIVSAFLGVLTVAVVYAWARTWFGTLAGLLTTALLAGSLWHVVISRFGLRVVTLPLLATLTLFLLRRALRTRSVPYACLAGLLGGIALYAHLAARLLPLLVALIVLAECVLHGKFLLRNFGLLAIAAAVWIVTFAPLATYFVTHPDVFLGRVDEVSLLSAKTDNLGHQFTGTLDRWRAIGIAAAHVAGMELYKGDGNGRHNVPDRPVFDPLTGALFLIGVGFAVFRLWGNRGRATADDGHADLWLLLWWIVMAFSSAFSIESPHYHRTAGSIPPVYALAAVGAIWLWDHLRTRKPHAPIRAVASLVVVGLCSVAGLRTATALFGPFATSDAEAVAWEAGLREFGEAVVGDPAHPSSVAYLQIGSDFSEMQVTTQYLSAGVSRRRWLPPDQAIIPLPKNGATLAYGGDVRLPLLVNFPQAFPNVPVALRVKVPPDARDYALYRLSSDDLDAMRRVETMVNASFGDQVALSAVTMRRLTHAPDPLIVSAAFRWSFSSRARDRYDFFVQLLAPSGKLAAQEDRTIPVSWLEADEQGITVHQLTLPPGAEPGRYTLIAGVASPDGTARLVPQGSLLPVTSSAIVLGTIDVP
jgi:hypothetical protein